MEGEIGKDTSSAIQMLLPGTSGCFQVNEGYDEGYTRMCKSQHDSDLGRLERAWRERELCVAIQLSHILRLVVGMGW